jgi:hypothetical protein
MNAGRMRLPRQISHNAGWHRMHWYHLDQSSSDVRLAAYHVTCSHENDGVKREQLLLPFNDVGEAVFADERSACARKDVVEEKDTKEGLFGRVEEMSERHCMGSITF